VPTAIVIAPAGDGNAEAMDKAMDTTNRYPIIDAAGGIMQQRPLRGNHRIIQIIIWHQPYARRRKPPSVLVIRWQNHSSYYIPSHDGK
jgi:hypothetical protein